MRIIHIILFLLLIAEGEAYAQLCKQSDFIKTDPDNYYNTLDPSNQKRWDWRGNTTYNFFMKNTTLGSTFFRQTQSPFYFPPNVLTSNDNVYSLRMQLQKDYQPVDGWELVHKDFGTSLNFNDAVESPTLVLYNRYRSILRVFCYIETEAFFNSALIQLSYTTSGNIAYNLNAVEQYQNTIDQRIGYIDAVVLNKYENNGGYWLMGDYLLSYDPCGCRFLTGFKVTPKLVNTTNIALIGTGNILQVVANGHAKAGGTTEKASNGIDDLVKNGQKGYETGQKFDNFIKNKLVPSQNQEIQSILSTGFGEFVAEYSKYAPIAGAAIGLFSTFFGGAQPDIHQPMAPLTFETNFNFAGKLTNIQPFGSIDFYNPGCGYQQPNIKQPVYNELLGVFGLLNQPTLEYVEYKANVGSVWDITGSGPGVIDYNGNYNPLPYMFPKIREYRVSSIPQFAINPASGLVLKDIEACMIFNVDTTLYKHRTLYTWNNDFAGPFELFSKQNYNIPYKERATKIMGLEIENWPDDPATNADNFITNKVVYRTPFVPLTCFEKTVFKVWENTVDIYCRVKVILKRPDSNDDKKDIIATFLYRVNSETPSELNVIERSYYLYHQTEDGFGILPGPHWDLRQNFVGAIDNTPWPNRVADMYKLTRIPYILNLDNLHITNATPMPIRAWDRILVGNNITVDPGVTVELEAGNFIDISPDNTFAPEFEAKINLSRSYVLGGGCTSAQPATQIELETFCSNSSKYNPIPLNQKRKPEDSTTPINQINKIFVIHPNPADAEFIVDFGSIDLDEPVSISISDIRGKVVYVNRVDASQLYAGKIQISIRDFIPGVYFVSVNVNGRMETGKLIIQR